MFLNIIKSLLTNNVQIKDFYEPLLNILNTIKNDSTLPIEDFININLNNDETSNSIVVFLRYLTSSFIRLKSDDYLPFLFAYEGNLPLDEMGMPDINQFCQREVESFGKEADHIQMSALSQALNVKINLCYLDSSQKNDEQVDWHTIGENSNENINVNLLYRPGHIDLICN